MEGDGHEQQGLCRPPGLFPLSLGQRSLLTSIFPSFMGRHLCRL